MTTGTWPQLGPDASWTTGLTRRGKPPPRARDRLRSLLLLFAGYALLVAGVLRLILT